MEENYNKKSQVTLFNLVTSFFKIGLTAYGMAILQQIKALIIGKKWLSQKEVDDGLAMVQLYPGPIMYNLAINCSYRLKGFWASMLASFFFLLPSYVLMVVLSYVYFNFATIGWVKPLFMALSAMVVGIVFHVFLDFGKRYVNNSREATIAAISFLLLLFHINALLIIVIAIILELVLSIFIKVENTETKKQIITDRVLPGSFSSRMLAIIGTGLVFVSIIVIGLVSDSENAKLLSSMFKIGAVAFGNGFTIMPLLQQEAVITHHWITMKQFSDGIAFGQITPGPFLITATFIGYKVSGVWGSIIATFGIFFPSFFYTLVVTEIYEKIKSNKWIKRSIKALMSAFTGMLAWVVLSLGEVNLKTPEIFIWAVASFVLVRYFKINILWIFLAGISLELLVYLI